MLSAEVSTRAVAAELSGLGSRSRDQGDSLNGGVASTLATADMSGEASSPGIARNLSSALLSCDIDKIIPIILKTIEEINWSDTSANDPNNPNVAKRLNAITRYLIKNIREQVGASDLRENLQYLTGFLASVSFVNVLNSDSLIKTNAVITSTIITYRMLDLYTQTAILKKEHFERQYKRLKVLFNEALENGLIKYNEAPEKITYTDEFTDAIKALVYAFYKLEQHTKTPITSLNKSKVTDCCINMMRALLIFINEEELKHRSNDNYKPRKSFNDHTGELFGKFEELLNARESVFESRICLPSLHNIFDKEHITIPSMQEFSRIIRNYYDRHGTFNESGASLLKMSLNLAENERFEKSHNTQEITVKELPKEFFLLASTSIQDDQKFKRSFLLLNGLLFMSSLLYGMSFNFSSLNLGLYTTFLSAAGAFVLAQKIDNIKAKVQSEHDSFKTAKRKLEAALKDGFLTDQSTHKTNWINRSVVGNHPSIGKNFHQLNCMIAETWEALWIMNHDPRALNRQSIAIASMNMYLAMGSAYEKTGNPHFMATHGQVTTIATACAELIKHNINQDSFYNSAAPLISLVCCKTAIGQIPEVGDFYKIIDKVLEVSKRRRSFDQINSQHFHHGHAAEKDHNNEVSEKKEPHTRNKKLQHHHQNSSDLDEQIQPSHNIPAIQANHSHRRRAKTTVDEDTPRIGSRFQEIVKRAMADKRINDRKNESPALNNVHDIYEEKNDNNIELLIRAHLPFMHTKNNKARHTSLLSNTGGASVTAAAAEYGVIPQLSSISTGADSTPATTYHIVGAENIAIDLEADNLNIAAANNNEEKAEEKDAGESPSLSFVARFANMGRGSGGFHRTI